MENIKIGSSEKNKNFALGFATSEFAGSKILGDNKESIGICGDGLIYFNDDQNKK